MIYPDGVKRIQSVFTDEDGNAYDPDSLVLKFYDSTGTLVETFDEDDCVNPTVGTWYIDYVIPTNGPTGRWTCVWTDTVTTKDYVNVFAFEVWSRTWPTIQEVRDYLAGMDDDRVTDAAVQIQIVVSVTEVEQEASASASEAILARAYLAVSGYQTYLAYATEFERTMGMVPGPILNHLGLLKAKAEQFMGYVRRGSGPMGAGPVVRTGNTDVPEAWDESNSRYRQ